MGLVKKFKFAYDFYETRYIYPCYENVVNKTNGKNYLNTTETKWDDLKHNVHIVNLINPYYDLILNEKFTQLKALKTHRDNGFMAQLDQFDTIEAYMNSKMSSKSRTKMRGYKRRLETCFNITYKMHFGSISKSEYDFLFSKFHSFLKNRFTQRGDRHEALEKWDVIKESTFNMIMNKTASLFVIYNDKQPIDICLNYHHQNIIDNAIRSYDIDYSKFRLGYVDIYVQLDWCFKNGVEVFDLSLGDFDYKRLWCNVIYKFEHHILYDGTNFGKRTLAQSLAGYYLIKEYLKKKNLHLYYHKFKKIFQAKNKPKSEKKGSGLSIKEIKNLDLLEGSVEIDLLNDKYQFLRESVYDFQYSGAEHSKNITVRELTNKEGTYFVLGKDKTISIAKQDN